MATEHPYEVESVDGPRVVWAPLRLEDLSREELIDVIRMLQGVTRGQAQALFEAREAGYCGN